MHYFSLFINRRQISSEIDILVTTASFRHFVSFFVGNEILWSLPIMQ